MGGNYPHKKHISSAEYRLVRGVIDYNESVRLVNDNVARINIRKVSRIFCNSLRVHCFRNQYRGECRITGKWVYDFA